MSAINYPLRQIRAVVFDVDGVLSPVTVPLGPDGIPCRMANLRDGYAMVQAVRQGLRLAVISGGYQESLMKRLQIIGLDEKDIFLGVGDKQPVLRQWMDDNGFKRNEVAYVGDDVPDVECMQYVGLSVTPADASPDTHQIALHVTLAEGGRGVAREVIEEILRDRKKWPGQSISLGQ